MTRIREKVYTCAPLLVPLVIFLVFDNNFTLLRSLLFLLHPEKMCDSDRLKIRDISLQGWSTNKILWIWSLSHLYTIIIFGELFIPLWFVLHFCSLPYICVCHCIWKYLKSKNNKEMSCNLENKLICIKFDGGKEKSAFWIAQKHLLWWIGQFGISKAKLFSSSWWSSWAKMCHNRMSHCLSCCWFFKCEKRLRWIKGERLTTLLVNPVKNLLYRIILCRS